MSSLRITDVFVSANQKECDLCLELCWAQGEEDLREAAALASKAFLSSSVFSKVDEDRYQAKRVFDAMRSGKTLLAFHLGTLVGTVTLFAPNPALNSALLSEFPSFGLLAVDPAASGQGVGTALILELQEAARVEGYGGLSLSVTKRGSDLIAMYERLGYSVEEEIHWAGAPDPSYIMANRFTFAEPL